MSRFNYAISNYGLSASDSEISRPCIMSLTQLEILDFAFKGVTVGFGPPISRSPTERPVILTTWKA